MLLIFGILLSYLVGSIPTAYILGKLSKGMDIRRYGSGNVGATNAFRVLGPTIGMIVLALDVLKGVVCVVWIADFILSALGKVLGSLLVACLYSGQGNCDFIIKYYTNCELPLRVLCGVIAVIGHSFTVFLRFKGGKGMATTLGVMIGLAMEAPGLGIILILEVLIWLIVFMLGRIVSLASIVSAVFFPAFFIILKQPLPLTAASLCLSLFIIIRHKPNIIRMLQNKEPRLNLGKSE